MKESIILSLALYTLICFSSCKEEPTTPEIKNLPELSDDDLISFRFSENNKENHVFISYSDDGMVSKLKSNTEELTFSRSNNKIEQITSDDFEIDVRYSNSTSTTPTLLIKSDKTGTPTSLTRIIEVDGHIVEISNAPIRRPSDLSSAEHRMEYNSDGSLLSIVSIIHDSNGIITLADTALYVKNDSTNNPFIVDPAFEIFFVLNNKPSFLGTKNAARLRMADGTTQIRSSKQNRNGKYIGFTESNGISQREFDIFYE